MKKPPPSSSAPAAGKLEHKLLKSLQNNHVPKAKALLIPSPKRKGLSAALGRSKENLGGPEPDCESLYDVDVRERLSHIDIDHRDTDNGYTPLMWAVLHGNRELVSMLLHFCADVNLRDNKGNTALHLAVFTAKSEMVELLLNRGALVNVVNHDGNTPLHTACQNGSKYVVCKLLRADPDVMITNKDGATPFDLAAQFDRLDAVALLLDHEPRFRESKRPFIEAAIRGHTAVVRLILNYGMPPDAPHDKTGATALHEACRYLRYDTVSVLLQFGADPCLLDKKNESAKTILAAYPADKVDNFLKLLQDSEGKPRLKPTYIEKEDSNGNRTDSHNEDEGFGSQGDGSAGSNRTSRHDSGHDGNTPSPQLLNVEQGSESPSPTPLIISSRDGSKDSLSGGLPPPRTQRNLSVSESSEAGSVGSSRNYFIDHDTGTIRRRRFSSQSSQTSYRTDVCELEWSVPPPASVPVDVPMPDFIVEGRVVGSGTPLVELIVEEAGVEGNNVVPLTLQGPGRPQHGAAAFHNITMLQEGRYTLTVRSVQNPEESVSSVVDVVPRQQQPRREHSAKDLEETFAELERLLLF